MQSKTLASFGEKVFGKIGEKIYPYITISSYLNARAKQIRGARKTENRIGVFLHMLKKTNDKARFWTTLERIARESISEKSMKRLVVILNKQAESFHFSDSARRAVAYAFPTLVVEEGVITNHPAKTFEELSVSVASATHFLPDIKNKTLIHRIANYYAEAWAFSSVFEHALLKKVQSGEADVLVILKALRDFENKSRVLPFATKPSLEEALEQYAQLPERCFDYEEALIQRSLQENVSVVKILAAIKDPTLRVRLVMLMKKEDLSSFLKTYNPEAETERAGLEWALAIGLINLDLSKPEIEQFMKKDISIEAKNRLEQYIARP